MGQYKVPQNVESEDKLIGPLSMKQFIYAIIGLAWGFLIWRLLLPGGGAAIPFMIILILPISGFMFLLAFGRREEQSFENYLIALIRFTVMPRKRTWMKDPAVEHAIIDAPVKPQPAAPTKADYQQTQTRLQQLALIVDTRGHAKADSIQLPDPNNQAAEFSTRVFTPQNLTQALVTNDIQTQDDILTPTETGDRAQAVGTMLQNVEQDIRAQAVNAMQNPPSAPQSENSNTQISPSPPQPALNDAILKTVMDTPDLTVSQVAQVANRGQLAPGQSIQFR